MAPNESSSSGLWLRRTEQAAAGGLLALALAAMFAFWAWQRSVGPGVIEIDRAPRATLPFLVDVNEAAWPELALLPNVGETLARRIVDYRTQRGKFRHLNELGDVRGIGDKTLEQMRPFLVPIVPPEAVAGP